MASRVVTRDRAVEVRARWWRDGQTVVLTNGCFDLLHVGHIRYLQQARSIGHLIVALNSDASTRTLKGASRPIVPEAERAEVLASLRCVDLVTIFDEPTAETILDALKPDVYVKGGDYGPTGHPLPEAAVAQRIGARVVLIPLVAGHSTSALVDRVRHREP
ncbi:MAG: adenylyltransferase/cytidyltransferase family protein [Chloroflexota bacterium]